MIKLNQYLGSIDLLYPQFLHTLISHQAATDTESEPKTQIK